MNEESEAAYTFLEEQSDKTRQEDHIINRALEILYLRMEKSPNVIDSPHAMRGYIKLNVGMLEHEVFGIIYLDTRHRIIKQEELFRGTIDGANIYPREVVKAALLNNAKSVIFYHNHPSGDPMESEADRRLTTKLQTALETVEIRVLDHMVVGGSEINSFAEMGLL